MLKSIPGTALALIITLPLQTLISANANTCDSRKYDPRDRECNESVEKRRAEDSKPKPLVPPKYPFLDGSLVMSDPSTGQNAPFSIVSENGSQITISYHKRNRPSLSINTSDLISWKSGIAGQGSDSSAAISSLVIGALFFPPLMLLAPFEVRNYTITGFEISYIDLYGKKNMLIFATNSNPVPVISLLKFATGLDQGSSQDEEATRRLYEGGLKRSLERLEPQRAKIMVVNSRKPWCTYLDLSNKTPDVVTYLEYRNDLQKLQKQLGLPTTDDSASATNDIKWQKYLSDNPGTKAWATAYPSQADKMKVCSSSNTDT